MNLQRLRDRWVGCTAQVPAFHACDLYQDTGFTKENDHWRAPTLLTADNDKSAYVRLRQLMNEMHKPDDEHFFFRQEMRCEALLRTGWDRLVIRLFGLVSDFGYSVTRPVLFLLGAVIIGWLALTFYFARDAVLNNGTKTTAEALGLSFSNTFGFLGLNRLYFGVAYWKDFHPALKVMGGAQSILGVVFLFFFGLGLRNRFRLK